MTLTSSSHGYPARCGNGTHMKKYFLLMAFTLALFVTIPAHAQGGCEDSPENPTLILAGLAGGAYAVSAVRMRIRAKRSKDGR